MMMTMSKTSQTMVKTRSRLKDPRQDGQVRHIKVSLEHRASCCTACVEDEARARVVDADVEVEAHDIDGDGRLNPSH